VPSAEPISLLVARGVGANTRNKTYILDLLVIFAAWASRARPLAAAQSRRKNYDIQYLKVNSYIVGIGGKPPYLRNPLRAAATAKTKTPRRFRCEVLC